METLNAAALESVEEWARRNDRGCTRSEDGKSLLLDVLYAGEMVHAVVTSTGHYLALTAFSLDELPEGDHRAAVTELIGAVNLLQTVTKLGVDPKTAEVRAQATAWIPAGGVDYALVDAMVGDFEWTIGSWAASADEMVRVASEASDSPTADALIESAHTHV